MNLSGEDESWQVSTNQNITYSYNHLSSGSLALALSGARQWKYNLKGVLHCLIITSIYYFLTPLINLHIPLVNFTWNILFPPISACANPRSVANSSMFSIASVCSRTSLDLVRSSILACLYTPCRKIICSFPDSTLGMGWNFNTVIEISLNPRLHSICSCFVLRRRENDEKEKLGGWEMQHTQTKSSRMGLERNLFMLYLLLNPLLCVVHGTFTQTQVCNFGHGRLKR